MVCPSVGIAGIGIGILLRGDDCCMCPTLLPWYGARAALPLVRDPSALALCAVNGFPLGFATRHVLGTDKGVFGARVAAESYCGFGGGASGGVPGVMTIVGDGVLDGQVAVPFGRALVVDFGAFKAEVALSKLKEHPFAKGSPAAKYCGGNLLAFLRGGARD